MGVKDALGDNKKFLMLVLALVVVCIFIVIGFNTGMYSSLGDMSNRRPTYTEPRKTLEEGVDYQMVVRTIFGDITIDLYEDVAPENVNSLLYLVSQRYYDNLAFHKVVKDFVIQAGDTKGDGTGDPGYSVGLENAKAFKDYSVGMANGSQFFIVLPNSDKSAFNGQYSLVGEVTSGFAVVDSIARVSVDDDYKPVNKATIKYIQIRE
jgi:peptidyl-prolyl cis-trans isomerase B (cyclophilin B)